jgi:hypothetical protein
MQEVFDPPEMKGETEAKIGTCISIRNDVVSEQDLGPSYELCMCPDTFRKPRILNEQGNVGYVFIFLPIL